jgi:hypothetical protein
LIQVRFNKIRRFYCAVSIQKKDVIKSGQFSQPVPYAAPSEIFGHLGIIDVHFFSQLPVELFKLLLGSVIKTQDLIGNAHLAALSGQGIHKISDILIVNGNGNGEHAGIKNMCKVTSFSRNLVGTTHQNSEMIVFTIKIQTWHQ